MLMHWLSVALLPMALPVYTLAFTRLCMQFVVDEAGSSRAFCSLRCSACPLFMSQCMPWLFDLPRLGQHTDALMLAAYTVACSGHAYKQCCQRSSTSLLSWGGLDSPFASCCSCWQASALSYSDCAWVATNQLVLVE